MPEQNAQHYLRIYRMKVGMAEDGITKPRQRSLEGMRALVAALEKLDALAMVRLDVTQAAARFIDVRSGSLLAELVLDV
jgi:hypothetical protein